MAVKSGLDMHGGCHCLGHGRQAVWVNSPHLAGLSFHPLLRVHACFGVNGCIVIVASSSGVLMSGRLVEGVVIGLIIVW